MRHAAKVCFTLLLHLAFATSVVAHNRTLETTDITFRSEGITLAGTLVIPSNPIAAVVLVHGSGQTKRMTQLAQRFAQGGIAVLTYDKRGVGRSEGNYVGPEVGTNNVDAENLQRLAADALAAIAELTRRMPRHVTFIGLSGGSQAGWVIPIAARQSESVRFMALWSGPLVTTREQLRFQYFTNQQPDFWERHSESEIRQRIATDEFDQHHFTDTNPLDSIAQLSIPGLWLFGGRDLNIPTAISIERLESFINLGKPYQYRVHPDLGHQLDKASFDVIIDWIGKESTCGGHQSATCVAQ